MEEEEIVRIKTRIVELDNEVYYYKQESSDRLEAIDALSQRQETLNRRLDEALALLEMKYKAALLAKWSKEDEFKA